MLDTTLPPDTSTAVSKLLEELRDVADETIAALADGRVTLGEILSIGIEVGQLGAAIVGLFAPDPEARAARKAARQARRAERKAARLAP